MWCSSVVVCFMYDSKAAQTLLSVLSFVLKVFDSSLFRGDGVIVRSIAF